MQFLTAFFIKMKNLKNLKKVGDTKSNIWFIADL